MSLAFLSGRGRTYLIAVCSILSLAAGAAAGVAPSPWSWTLAAVALLAGGVAGLASKVPAVLVGRPMVGPSLALALGSISAVLVQQAFSGPEGMGRAAILALAVACAGLAGKPLQLPGAAAAQAGVRVLALLVLAGLVGCSTGPRRAGLMGGGAEPVAQEAKASPFSVGPMLAVVVPFSGEKARPAELVVGTVRLNGGEGRAVNALAFGGFAGESFGEPGLGNLTGGLGGSVELTPGNLLYSVDLGAGLVFGDFNGPAATLGITVQTKF